MTFSIDEWRKRMRESRARHMHRIKEKKRTAASMVKVLEAGDDLVPWRQGDEFMFHADRTLENVQRGTPARSFVAVYKRRLEHVARLFPRYSLTSEVEGLARGPRHIVYKLGWWSSRRVER